MRLEPLVADPARVERHRVELVREAVLAPVARDQRIQRMLPVLQVVRDDQEQTLRLVEPVRLPQVGVDVDLVDLEHLRLLLVQTRAAPQLIVLVAPHRHGLATRRRVQLSPLHTPTLSGRPLGFE